MVGTERAIGLEIILDAADGIPRRRGSCGILFRSIQRRCLCQNKIGAQFAPNVPLAQKASWTHPMVLLGDEAQVEACSIPFRDSASLGTR
jgi:hypothetical protein